jgi:dipeptidyl aminopeptidase/acylaminoacyl peptidase
MRRFAFVIVLGLVCSATPRLHALETPGGDAEISRQLEALQRQIEAQSYAIEQLQKKVDDVLWFERVADVAELDKLYIPTVPVPMEEPVYGIANERHPFRMWTYVFVPRGLDRGRKHPLLLLPHGGVHADFDTYYTHVVRELMAQGYVVVAPEYRGSTGYGRDYQQAIDYGGLEVDDVVAARDWALATYPFCDPGRVGIVGWSHGGLIALMAAFDHPDKFQVAYAGVPVSDLIARLGYQTEEYRRLFSAPYHIGKRVDEAVDEYRRRSPVTHVAKLRVPLLVHTTTNDRDVNVLEVRELIAALQAAGKTFEYKVYEDAPGGHSFNRMDSALAHESRGEVYRFLAKHLGR